MYTSYRTIGKNLILGGIITVIWAFWCPKYQPFKEQYVTRHGDSAGSRSYYKMDLGVFMAGEVAIWTAIWGVFFLSKKHPSDQATRSKNAEQAGRGDGDKPSN